MLRSEIKSCILLLFFSFLLSEYLSLTTIGFVVLGTVLLYFKIAVSKALRTFLALGIFSSYWFIFGKVIDPEVGLNFLTTVIVLKLLEKESLRDRYMIFFGMILLLSAGSLFEKTLTYAIFYGTAFAILLHDFYRDILVRWRAKDLGYAFLWVIPLTLILFFIFPRLLNPLPFGKGQPRDGEVGFTPNVNISEIEKLAANDTPVFQALVDQELRQGQLYWRGNTLSHTDGWNWSRGPEMGTLRALKENETFDGTKQSIRLLNKEEYFFALDHPLSFIYSDKVGTPSANYSLAQRTWQWTANYLVYSNPASRISDVKEPKADLQISLPEKDRSWIREEFKGETVEVLSREFKKKIYDEGFIYSLAPGRISNFRSFMLSRKIGFCSHYASSLALILRVKGIPARLVSGFMGGTYNRFASYYLITQNDAHVWVEAYENGEWIKLDPTEWIAPDRVKLGGEAFMNSTVSGNLNLASRFRMDWIKDAQLWFKQWDFRFYTFIDEMDYHGQAAWLYRLNLKRIWLYTFLPLAMALFMIGYFYFNQSRNRKPKKEIEELWQLFFKQTKKNGLVLAANSIHDQRLKIEQFKGPKQKEISSIWESLVKMSFGEIETVKLKDKIKKI